MGGGSYISRLLGAKQKDKAEQVASTALITGAIIAIITAVLMLCALNPLLRFMGATDSILPYARNYTMIFIVSTIFSSTNVASGNLAVSQGASTVSLVGMITGAVLNMILDPILIYKLDMGVRGAAAATLISQLVTLSVYIWFFKSGKSYVRFGFSLFRPAKETYKEVIKIGLSMLFLQVLSSISMSLITRGARAYGDEAVAALGVVLRIVTLGSNVVFGYMKGFQPMAGFNYGAKNYTRLKEAIRCSIKWTTVFGVVWTIIIFLTANPLISQFGTDAEFFAIGQIALRANSIMFFTFGFQFTYSTLYLALGKAVPGMVLM